MEPITKIELTEKEQHVYETIKNLTDHGGNKKRAALQLGCSVRSIERYIAGYLAEGKAYFQHGNRGRKPQHSLDPELEEKVIALYRDAYSDATFAHFTDLLAAEEGIHLFVSSVFRILSRANILSPQATRKTKRVFKAKLKDEAKATKSKKKKAQIQARILALYDAHPRRPRSPNFGEMIQMDASLHPWFGDAKSTLHLAEDDASGTIVGAWFEEQETLRGYYHVFYQILTDYGIPHLFYTDRRSVFEYRKTGSSEVADDAFTQFGYACKHLGVHIKTTSVPQAKGRIERLISSMQTRLPIELRLKGVTSIEQANAFLPEFVSNYNRRFSIDYHSLPSVFEESPTPETINLTLAVIYTRTVDGGSAIHLDNQFFRTINRSGIHVSLRGGSKGLVIRTFNNDLFFSRAMLYLIALSSSGTVVNPLT